MGVKKPNPKIYEIALEKTGVKGEEALFIDDRLENLPPAQKLGMETVLYTNPETLRREIDRILSI